MNNNPMFQLSKYRIDKAKEDLRAAEILFENNLFSQSLNRSYYPIFHAVRAVFVYEKFDSRKHSGIISHFNKRYIKEGIFDKEYSKILMGAEKIRNKSDYNDFYIVSREDARNQIMGAEIFIDTMEKYIDEYLLKENGS